MATNLSEPNYCLKFSELRYQILDETFANSKGVSKGLLGIRKTLLGLVIVVFNF